MEPNDQAGSAVVSAQLVVSLVVALAKVTATYAEFNHMHNMQGGAILQCPLTRPRR